MTTIRYTPDQKYQLYDDIKFMLHSGESAETEIVPTVSLFVSKELIIAPAAQIDELDFYLTDAMKQMVVDYKMRLMATGTIYNDLEKMLVSVRAIKRILDKPNTMAYLYDHIDQAFSDLKQAGHTIMPWDKLLIGAPELQERFFAYMLNKIGPLPAHRPTDLETHRNAINKRFVERLMEIYKLTTVKKPTPVSATTNTNKTRPTLLIAQENVAKSDKQKKQKMKSDTKKIRRQTTPFVEFAETVIQTINESHPGLDGGVNINFNVSTLVKEINKKNQ